MRTEQMPRRSTARMCGCKGLLFGAACLPLLFSAAHAQKGMGDREGVVRQGLRPALATLSGKIVSVETHPCEKTTGPSPAGTHVIVAGVGGVEYNVHLGPAAAVEAIAEQLRAGSRIEAAAFRTVKLPNNHYVAVTLRLQDSKGVFHLRDANLRPFWSERSRLEARNKQKCGRGRGCAVRSQWLPAQRCAPGRGLRGGLARRGFR
ncbi:MAG: hypothetical protein IH624_06280 [Phycisphaerae bacterium]|nr:hypothetical protein [Phycisphaerae bacterium]